jgi:hypothetical protein
MSHADAINLEELESQGRQLDALQDMEAPEGAFRWALHGTCYNTLHFILPHCHVITLLTQPLVLPSQSQAVSTFCIIFSVSSCCADFSFC